MEAITLSYIYQVSADKLWNAITRPDEMKQWYFTIHDFELQEGSVFTFYETETGGAFLHRCMIRSIISGQKFEHTWEHPSHTKGISVLSWDIEAISENTSRLTLTHAGTENFADGGPEFATENYIAGWKEILGYSLRNYLYGIEKLIFETDIAAPKERVWELLWGKESYQEWTSPFMAGSYFEGEFGQGKRVHLLSPTGEGLYSDILIYAENEQLTFNLLGNLKNKEEQPLDAESEIWTGSRESYFLTDTPAGTRLRVQLDNQKEYGDQMNKAFPAALQILKEMAEGRR
ncbi:hypothetical protein DSL64_13390 [Dyadobacter luteus]|uniref:Activator of Hsp90 ATPase homologue 1/2-like C-terminal domain-containing protein n=1 Tax=Dyadobacter luteus TaxID=2259619 RepID=A0A3D8YAQ5_9BACT|nr:SRPBCC family protein [Dyadobacter luteus]REA60890.1 hypothetical protein DSL64_13390 [Dyadobacter luteus]